MDCDSGLEIADLFGSSIGSSIWVFHFAQTNLNKSIQLNLTISSYSSLSSSLEAGNATMVHNLEIRIKFDYRIVRKHKIRTMELASKTTRKYPLKR